MGKSFRCETVFASDQESVFALMTDLDRAPEWMQGLERIEVKTEGPFGVGTRFDETRKVFGKSWTESFEVTGHDAPRSVDLFVPSKGVDYRFRYVCEPVDGGTRLTLIGEAEPKGFMSKLMMGVMGMGPMRSACHKDMEHARDYLDGVRVGGDDDGDGVGDGGGGE